MKEYLIFSENKKDITILKITDKEMGSFPSYWGINVFTKKVEGPYYKHGLLNHKTGNKYDVIKFIFEKESK